MADKSSSGVAVYRCMDEVVEKNKSNLALESKDELTALPSETKAGVSRFKVHRVGDEEVLEDSESDSEGHGLQQYVSNQYGRDGSSTADSPPATFSLSPTDTYRTHSYDTCNLKTFGMNTHEALPHVDHYRNLLSTTGALKTRPTLAQLHDSKQKKDDNHKNKLASPLLPDDDKSVNELSIVVPDKRAAPAKFGWIKGVLVRCLLNIWGVMLFLRLSWVVGQAGIGLATLIILLSAAVTVITTLSMSAICTNGEVKGGGAYYLISRSLGPEFGGAIGLVFSVANAVAIAMYVVGFAETVRDLLKKHDALLIDEVNDIRIIGCLTITVLLAVAIIGMEWEARAQLVLLVILLLAVTTFIIGTFIPATEEKKSKGFIGFDLEVFKDNFMPDFYGEEFFSVFSIFFPAATGILAGANISGDLKDAQKSIPKGTLLAILLSSIMYILVAFILGSTVMRDANGIIPVLNTSGVLVNISEKAPLTFKTIKNCSLALDKVCKYGLMKDYQVMELASAFGPFVTAGIFSATLSSALASLVSAPKVFQAVCKDKIFPGIHIFAKGHGKGDNPRRLYILAYFIGVAFICIGDLNAIAPIISNFFLMSYALINYSCFDASLAKSPGWRPAFRWYSMWMSLLGAMLCIAVMFIIKWWTALLTFVVIVALYVYVHYRKPDVNWGSSTQAHVYKNALQSSLKLIAVEDHIKNFRPQVLVLTGVPSSRPALVDFVASFTRNISLMICGHVVEAPKTDTVKNIQTSDVYCWLRKRHVKSFYNVVVSPDFRLGAQSLMQSTGVGKLRPNTLFIGFKSSWRNVEPEQVEDYFNVIHDAFDMQYGVGILRVPEGFHCDASSVLTSQGRDTTEDGNKSRFSKLHGKYQFCDAIAWGSMTPSRRPSYVDGDGDGSSMLKQDDVPTPDIVHESIVHATCEQMSETTRKMINRFHSKQKKGTIDVWWLFDDGGLTLLIPYILSTKSSWSNCRLRVFTAGTKKGELDREQRQLATLLSKFRIECKDMKVIPDVAKPPREESIQEFESLLDGWIMNEEIGETREKYPWKTTEDQINFLKDKTNRHIRLRELLLQHSKDSMLIVMTLPMPRKGTCSSSLYMAWIDTLTRDMPPILLLRGNQTSVLTFYS